MITRRSLIGTSIAVPAVSLFGDLPFRFGTAVAKSMDKMVSDAARQWVADNTREYNPSGGDLGRGVCMPVDEALFIVPALREAGFTPYRLQWVPSFMMESRFFPVYSASGTLAAQVWHAFVRERDGRHQIVAIEHWDAHLSDFKSRTGLTLAEAMEQA